MRFEYGRKVTMDIKEGTGSLHMSIEEKVELLDEEDRAQLLALIDGLLRRGQKQREQASA